MAFDDKGNPVIPAEGSAPAADPDVTVDPSSTTQTPDPTPVEEPSASEPHGRKIGAEERIGQLVGEREFWKGRALASTAPVPPPPPVAPAAAIDLDPNDFDSDAAYLKAVATQVKDEIRQTAAQAQTQVARDATQKAIQESAVKSRAVHADFDAVALNPMVPTSQTMVDAMEGDNYAEILYALGSNLAEATRIYGLPPVQQIKEIGKIEARISKPITKTTTSAPNPVPIVTGSGSANADKDPSKMTRKELHGSWAKTREEELRRKYG
jgi:hypothetical protein